MRQRQTDPAGFAHAFGRGIEEVGFVKLVGHPVDLPLIERARQVTTEVFRHPDTILAQWETPENGRRTGFTSTGVERSRDTPPERADLKRFWHVRGPKQGFPELYPDALVPGFRPALVDLYRGLEGLALELLGDLDHYLGHDGTPLRAMATGGDTLLRVIDYPPVGDKAAHGAVRAGAHEDINLITVMVPATSPGLQVMDRDGTWHDANEEPEQIIVDGGDMLQLYTGGTLDENWKVHGGRLRATTHRVVNPASDADDVGRHSFPMFIHPKATDVLEPRRGIMAQHYLYQRFVEIGIMDPAIRDAFFAKHPLLAA